jgi:hypothetical protein
MNKWTWLYLAVAGAVFGYWQNNIAAGIFMFLFLLLPDGVAGHSRLSLPRYLITSLSLLL